MAKLPSSFREKNRTTRQFREQYARLPKHVQQATRASCILFDQDPAHPSLRAHDLAETKQGQHFRGSVSVSVSLQYRAIFVAEGATNVWYWIGSHAEYDRFTGRK